MGVILDLQLSHFFDESTIRRGLDYADRGLVTKANKMADNTLIGNVLNRRGKLYRQHIIIQRNFVTGTCTCPVGFNCKHIVAVLSTWMNSGFSPPSLTVPVLNWLESVQQKADAPLVPEMRPEDYPKDVKDRILYILISTESKVKIEIYKGRVNAAGTALNKTMNRYDAFSALRNNGLPNFFRPIDLELLPVLAHARLWETYPLSSLPDLFRPAGRDVVDVIQRLCATGRFLHSARPDAQLSWSEEQPKACLAWRVAEDGKQALSFETAEGASLHLQGLSGATLWLDSARGHIGMLAEPIPIETLRLAYEAPEVAPEDVDALTKKLPDTLAGFALPRPHMMRRITRAAHECFARLTLGVASAREGHSRWNSIPVRLPTLRLRFVYDGQEVGEDDADPRSVQGADIVTLTRNHQWEEDCLLQLMAAGAVLIDELDFFWPGEQMQACDLVFLEDEVTGIEAGLPATSNTMDFAFRVLPILKSEGWEIIEDPSWPFYLSDEPVALAVTTQSAAGDEFQGNEWFSLGFQAEIAGKPMDVAPLIAAFLRQLREDWEVVPDVDTLSLYLADKPIYLNQGKSGYVALDLSPLAPLLHLVLTHYAELGALHPSDANIARLAEEALAGSTVRFSDNAGIIPLARSLNALAEAESFTPPIGLRAQLRPYQAYGSAWMGSLLEAGFGGILADDMGLGKTIQVLALLQARREAEVAGPALLIVPTSLLHSWQRQAAEFTPELQLVVLHGRDRMSLRGDALQADLVVTTYPLLSRDHEWLREVDWQLVILDEAQTLKNPASQTAKTLRHIPAKGRLALTGTPLENSLQDLWTLVDWVNPGLLGDRKGFQTLFRTPIEKHGDRAAQSRLNRRLRPFMLRRTKSDVAGELPPKTEILERVNLPKPQQALYETVRSAMDARVREAIMAKGLSAARITVLDALLKLRQVCCDPALVKSDTARSVTDSAKRARLRELLAELVAEGRRVLVFSQFVEMLRLIEADLIQADIPYLTLTGQTQKRTDVLEAFAQGDAPVFLLSLKAGGVGLTLTEADTVILYDPWWNPAVERQAMDRAHRIGQDKPVFVHRLVAAGTVEEKILNMQSRKQALADALFEQNGGSTNTLLDEATLQDLFAPLDA